MTQKDAAAACGWSGARLSYLENGQQTVTDEDLVQLLDVYKVAKGQRARYYEAGTESRHSGWWEEYSDVAPEFLVPYVGFEQGAAQIRTFQLVAVPGQLQTPEYAESVMREDPNRRSSRVVDRLVELRMRRQEILKRSSDPVNLSAVIDEGVLFRAPGGKNYVLTDQIRHLVELASEPNVEINVLPFDKSISVATIGSFVILTLALDDPDPDVVYVERRSGGSSSAVLLEDLGDIETYMVGFDAILDLTLSPDDSLAKMLEILGEVDG